MKLVFIHGRKQQGLNPVDLLAEWKTSLLRGLSNSKLTLPADLKIVFPFYADQLTDLLVQLETPSPIDVVTKGDDEFELDEESISDEASLQFDILYEMAIHAGITDEQIQANMPIDYQEKGVRNWRSVRAILQTLDSTPLGKHVIARITKDVSVYLTYNAVSSEIDKIVADEFKGDESYVVVGHSLGSIIGYNVLRKLSSQKKIISFITLGSPLGIKAVRNQLDTPLVHPPCVRKWYNALDRRDVVSLYPLDEKNFPVLPTIINKVNVNNHTQDRHGIDGYLDDPDVAVFIAKALQES